MVNKKPTILDKFNKLFPLITLVGGLGTLLSFTVWGSTLIEEFKHLMFSSPEMQVKTELWINSPHNEVELYKIQKQSIETTERSLEASEKNAKAIRFVDSIFKNDLEDKANRIKSRAKRDSINILMLEQLSKINNSMEKIELRQKVQGTQLDSIIKN